MARIHGFSIKYGVKERHVFLVLFLLAFVTRLIYLNQISTSPFFKYPLGDAAKYFLRAMEISEGNWLGSRVFFHSSPLYPYFLAIIIKVFGINFYAIRFFQIVIGASNCLLVYLVGKRIFNYRVAILASVMCSFYGIFIFFDGQLLMASLVIFFTLLSILFLLKFREKNRFYEIFLSGIFLGLSALGKPNLLLFIPFVLFWLFIEYRKTLKSLQHRLKPAATFCGGICLIILPVTLRNYIVGKDFVLISCNGGINFFIGNNKHATGGFHTPPGLRRNLFESSEEYAEKYEGKRLLPSEVSRFWFRKGLNFVRENPGKELRLLIWKFVLFWKYYEIPNLHNYYFFKRYSSLMRLPLLSFGIIGPLGLLGIFMNIRNWRRTSLLYFFMLAYIISVLPFFVTSRYRLPIIPFLIIFSAQAIGQLIRGFQERRFKFSIMTMVLFAVFFLAVNKRISEVNFSRSHNQLGIIYFSEGAFNSALSEFSKSLQIDSTNYSAMKNLALCYEKIGKDKEAGAIWEKAKQVKENQIFELE